jgi:hypothetical protein
MRQGTAGLTLGYLVLCDYIYFSYALCPIEARGPHEKKHSKTGEVDVVKQEC